MLVGLNTNEGFTIQRSEQQLPSVTSEPFYAPHYDQKSETNDEKKALAAHENKQYVKKVGGETKTNAFIKVPYQYKNHICICCRSKRCTYIYSTRCIHSQDVQLVPINVLISFVVSGIHDS